MKILIMLKQFWKEENGSGVVEAILILVVLIALVTLFKGTLSPLVEDILKNIKSAAGKI